ncbi:MAG: OsmC family protein [Kiloniellales bacterium]
MKAKITWSHDRVFIGESGTGHGVLMSSIGDDGKSLGPTPMEMVLVGTGACTAYDVVDILEKSREPIEGCVAEMEAERAPEAPRVFTRIHVHFVITGRGLNPEKVQRAIDLTAEKYCAATIMLAKTAEVTHDFEIVEP